MVSTGGNGQVYNPTTNALIDALNAGITYTRLLGRSQTAEGLTTSGTATTEAQAPSPASTHVQSHAWLASRALATVEIIMVTMLSS